ncbi:SDR family oxidoreductase [Kitasatospora sp. NPDC051914]|uniref:SDR family NAD(P)-dependent oxidoreductase n=1 Tax=Kitasatospora sp. NPDC051914 TaxID=3154945 RepID=UPI003447CD56
MGEPDFAGLAAVVTGGASGIGLAAAGLLAARGARVACLDVRPEGVPSTLVRAYADVADEQSVRAGVAWAAELLGGIDILVNCAGVGARDGVEPGGEEEWRRMFEVGVLGVMRTTRAALPYLRRSPAPAIVNTCPVAAAEGLPAHVLSSASKGAVRSMTRTMAADLAADGIRVTCVDPGSLTVPGSDPLPDADSGPTPDRDSAEARSRTGHPVTAERVATAIAYLAGPHTGATTGTDLAVDGGVRGPRLLPRD